MADCGHLCCPIRSNPYHAHLRPPQACPGCRRDEPHKNSHPCVEPAAPVDPSQWPQVALPPSASPHPRVHTLFPVPELSDVEHMDADLDHVVRDVLRWLPEGDELQELVLCAALHAYGEALEERELQGLELRFWRRLLVGSALGWLATALDVRCWTNS
jgi:hypothetical protein